MYITPENPVEPQSVEHAEQPEQDRGEASIEATVQTEGQNPDESTDAAASEDQATQATKESAIEDQVLVVPEALAERFTQVQVDLWQAALNEAQEVFAAKFEQANANLHALQETLVARETELAELQAIQVQEAEVQAEIAQQDDTPISPLDQLQRAAVELSTSARIETLEALLADAKAAVEAADQRTQRAEYEAKEARTAMERSRKAAQRAHSSEQAAQAKLELLSRELEQQKIIAAEASSIADAAREEAAELRGQVKALQASKTKKK